MKKFLSLILSLVMILSLTVSASASASESQRTETFEASATSRLEITYTTENPSSSLNFFASPSGRTTKETFVVKQFENDTLFQTVAGEMGGEEIIVTNYDGDNIVSTEVILVADIVTKNNATRTVTENTAVSPRSTSNYGFQVGYITYNITPNAQIAGRISVFSKPTYTDNESYTVRGKASDTLGIIVAALTSAVGNILAEIIPLYDLVAAIVSEFGGNLAAEIGIAFTEDVAVVANHYTMTGYDYTANRYSNGHDGAARRVTTQSSEYYNEWFYDDFTPHAWKNNRTAAYLFWYDLYGYTCPGVLSYT